MLDKLTPVEGYDWKNYNNKQGIDASGNDVVSNKVIEQVAEVILGGYADSSVKDILYRTYGMNSYCTKFIIMKAHRFIMDYEEKQTDKMLQKQNARLFRLYRMALDSKDNKTALAILSEINKLNKLYVNKVEVSTSNFILDLGLTDTSNKSDE